MNKTEYTPVEKPIKDSLGQELKEGDRIAYAVGAGRSQVLNFYELVELHDRQSYYMSDGKKEYYGEKSLSIKARYLGGHAWRYGKTREFSTLFFPDSRALKLPTYYVIPEKLKTEQEL